MNLERAEWIEGPVDAKSIAESYHEKDVEAARVEVVAKA